MKLEYGVCNLELAKRLIELGVEPKNFKKRECPSFTVAELGELLPHLVFDKNNISYDLRMHKNSSPIQDNYVVRYENMEEVLVDYLDYTEANVRARMLIYLLENNLIKNNKGSD